jgi:Ca2+/Na+ antiporter
MNGIPWVLVGIVVGIVVLAIGMVVAFRKRKEPRRVDYRNYFVMGVIWLLFAPVMALLPWILHGEEPFFMGFFFLVMGIAYMIIGLRNRDKWGKQVEPPPRANKIVLGLVLILGILSLLGLVAFTLFI